MPVFRMRHHAAIEEDTALYYGGRGRICQLPPCAAARVLRSCAEFAVSVSQLLCLARSRFCLLEMLQENRIRRLQGFVILAVSGAKPLHCGNEYIVIAALTLELL